MRLKKVEDIDSQIVYISPEVNYGDFPLYFLLRIQHTGYFDPEWEKTAGKYNAEILAVSPEAARSEWERCRNSVGLTEDQWHQSDAETKALLLAEYGVSAMLWQSAGNNLQKLIRHARTGLEAITCLFGFYMDQPQNRIGSTGWDCIRGDLLAGLNRQSVPS